MTHDDDRAARALREAFRERASGYEVVPTALPTRRRRWAVPAAVAAGVAAVALAVTWVVAPGTQSPPAASPSPSPVTSTEPQPLLEVGDDGRPLLRCQGGAPTFPVSALDGALNDRVPRAEIVQMLARATRDVVPGARVGTAPQDVDYVLLAEYQEDGEPRLLVGFGPWPADRDALPRGEAYEAERDDRGWYLTGGGRCDLVPAATAFLANLYPPTADGAEGPGATVLVGALEPMCTGGRDVRDHLLEPFFVETATTVTVYQPVGPIETSGDGGISCPGPPVRDIELELPSPLGDRVLLDGSVWPPQQVLP
jgi:hypothetical protein